MLVEGDQTDLLKKIDDLIGIHVMSGSLGRRLLVVRKYDLGKARQRLSLPLNAGRRLVRCAVAIAFQIILSALSKSYSTLKEREAAPSSQHAPSI